MTETSKSRPALLIVGASTRAAAQSSVRAGYRPICADCFGDCDLRAIAEYVQIEDYPNSLCSLMSQIPPCPWMYTGALENYSKLVDEITNSRPLLGNPAKVLERVRDPFDVEQFLSQAGLPALEVRRNTDPPQADGNWLVKPIRSAAGARIARWTAETKALRPITTADYFQKRASGISVSALFLAAQSQTWLLGITNQSIGNGAGTHLQTESMSAYGYRGSFGPLTPSDLKDQIAHFEGSDVRHAALCGHSALYSQVHDLGQTLAKEYQLRGLFGCDLVISSQGVRLIEVNPRYPASTEIIELAYDIPLLRWHVESCQTFDAPRQACVDFTPEIERAMDQRPWRYFSKRILFAATDGRIPRFDVDRILIKNYGRQPLSWLADIPTPETKIKQLRPVCTVIATGENSRTCDLRIESQIEHAQQLFQMDFV